MTFNVVALSTTALSVRNQHICVLDYKIGSSSRWQRKPQIFMMGELFYKLLVLIKPIALASPNDA